MKRYFECAECDCKKAELKYEDRIEQKEGKTMRIVGVPYYLCPECREATYLLGTELEIERMFDEWQETDETYTIEFMENKKRENAPNIVR